MLAGVAVRDVSVTDLSNAGTVDACDASASATDSSNATDLYNDRSASSSSSSAKNTDTAELMKEADRPVGANGSSVNASIEDCTAVLIKEANLMVEATASTTSTMEDEPLTRIARGLKQAEALLLQTEESNLEETKLDIAKQFVTYDDSQNVSEYFTPGA